MTQRPETVLADAGYWHQDRSRIRQRRDPSAGPSRRWVAERREAWLGQRDVCVHAPSALQRARAPRSTSSEKRRSSRCSRRSSSTARSTDSNAEDAPPPLSEWRLVDGHPQPHEAPQPLDRRRNRLRDPTQPASAQIHPLGSARSHPVPQLCPTATARCASLMKRAPTPAFVLARVFRLTAPGRLRLSDSGSQIARARPCQRGCIGVQAATRGSRSVGPLGVASSSPRRARARDR